MKFDKQTSFKDRLNQDVDSQAVPSNDTHHIARDAANTTTILFIAENEKRSFAYSYFKNVGMDDKTGDIDVNFTSGKIVIKGKNLDQLFTDLHRHKVADVNINTDDIDDITITLNRD